jgi:hypothetical protein
MVQNWRYRVMTAAVAAPKRLTRTAMAKAPHDRERLRRWLCRSCLLQPLDILPSLTVNNFYVACGILLPFAEFDSPLPLRTTSLNPPLNTIYIILHTKSIYPRRFSNHASHSVPEAPRFLFLVNEPQTTSTSLTRASLLPLWHAKFQHNIILHTISIYASQIIKLRFRLHSKSSEVSLSLWETFKQI